MFWMTILSNKIYKAKEQNILSNHYFSLRSSKASTKEMEINCLDIMVNGINEKQLILANKQLNHKYISQWSSNVETLFNIGFNVLNVHLLYKHFTT